MVQDSKRQLLFFGHGKELNRLPNSVHDEFAEHGLQINWRSSYPNVEYHDVRAVLDDEDLDYKRGEWLRDVRLSSIKGILQVVDTPKPAIGGWGLTATPRDFNQWRNAAEGLSLPENIRYELVDTSPRKTPPGHPSESRNSNAPFSYDPAQDYSTEPGK